MFSASKLTDEQKSALQQWAAGGASIADLQKRLRDDFDVAITYMDTRFLVLDLGIEIAEAPKEEKKPAAIWMLDQYGRPGLDADTPGYRPSQEDVMEFQKQLAELVRNDSY